MSMALIAGLASLPAASNPNSIPEYAVGWGTLAIINAGLAQAKNRSGLAWFFASLFLGPFATLFIVMLDKEPA